MISPDEKPAVIVTTKHRGVFFGHLVEDQRPQRVSLEGARCAIRFGTTGGFMQLAATGPTPNTKAGPAVDCDLEDITSVTRCSPEAVAAWEKLA